MMGTDDVYILKDGGLVGCKIKLINYLKICQAVDKLGSVGGNAC